MLGERVAARRLQTASDGWRMEVLCAEQPGPTRAEQLSGAAEKARRRREFAEERATAQRALLARKRLELEGARLLRRELDAGNEPGQLDATAPEGAAVTIAAESSRPPLAPPTGGDRQRAPPPPPPPPQREDDDEEDRRRRLRGLPPAAEAAAEQAGEQLSYWERDKEKAERRLELCAKMGRPEPRTRAARRRLGAAREAVAAEAAARRRRS